MDYERKKTEQSNHPKNYFNNIYRPFLKRKTLTGYIERI